MVSKLKKPKMHLMFYGLSETHFYDSYANMVERCTQPRCIAYSQYGAIGIKVTTRWMDQPDDRKGQGFRNFFEDMYPSYVKRYYETNGDISIDRKRGAMEYNKDNCKWSTRSEQNRNKSNAKPIKVENGVEVFGVDKAPDVMKISNICTKDPAIISYIGGHIQRRVFERGWSYEEAISTPFSFRKGTKIYDIYQKTKTKKFLISR